MRSAVRKIDNVIGLNKYNGLVMSPPNFNLQSSYIADSVMVALGIWNSTLESYCLLVIIILSHPLRGF